jgi:adenylate cyclase
MERRISAIFAADMVGYSRLMEADEIGTLEKQKLHRRELIDPAFSKYHGRLFKEIGDGILVEFSSVVEAVQCAVEIQRAMPTRQIELPESRQIIYRIGINLGDVISDEDDVYGDGVNVAARLESVAEPGGICISGTAYDQMRSNVEVDYESLGEIQAKNIERPIRAYRILFEGKPYKKSGLPSVTSGIKRGLGLRILMPLALLVGLAVVSYAAYFGLTDPGNLISFDEQDSQTAAQNPSIAIFPFRNLNNSGDDAYLAAGISEDVMANISQSPNLLVIAPSTPAASDSGIGDLRKLAAGFGATYVLSGGLRRNEDETRVNVQLVNVGSGESVWAKIYQPSRADLVSVSDVIAKETLQAIPGAAHISHSETQPTRRHFPDPEAYDLLLQGNVLFSRFTLLDLAAARDFYQRAIEIDPNYARPRANFAFTLALEVGFGWSDDPENDLRKAESYINEALRLDPTTHQAYLAQGVLLRAQRRYDAAIKAFARAIELSPNSADAYSMQSLTFVFSGDPNAALKAIDSAMRRSPDQPFFYLHTKAMALLHLERYPESVELFRAALSKNADFVPARLGLASALAILGNLGEAEWEYQEVLVRIPEFTLLREQARAPYADTNDLLRYMGGLKIAAGE